MRSGSSRPAVPCARSPATGRQASQTGRTQLYVSTDQLLSEIKLVLKEDDGLDINDKTKILVKGITVAEAHAAEQRLLAADPFIAHLGPLGQCVRP